MNKFLAIDTWTDRFHVIDIHALQIYLSFVFSHNIGCKTETTEYHHIMPWCLDQSVYDDPGNLVYLTVADHLYAHQLLCQGIFDKESEEMWSLSSAFSRMVYGNQYSPTDEQIELAKQYRTGTKCPEYVKDNMSGPRDSNGLDGKTWMCNPITKDRQLVDDEDIPSLISSGYQRGFEGKGSKWMHKDGATKRFRSHEIQSAIADGWEFGMR